ncbi:MAG TPA: DUF929 family protein [Acidimicrobiales bacterium]|nr:DUF929 family protein [Acidimicrobiales bacterium]
MRLAAPVVVVVVVFAALLASRGGNSNKPAAGSPDMGSTGSAPAPAAVVDAVTHVPASALDSAAVPSVAPSPQVPKGASPMTSGGKPVVFYDGAEFCPMCAAQRWPMTVALSRFGTFSGLRISYSSTTDSYPATRTLSYYKSTYTSPYLVFEPVEETTNIPSGSGGGYTHLESVTPEQRQVLDKYDQPPYSGLAYGIPFVWFGGHYLMSGPSYDPVVLQGKSWTDISGSLANPSQSAAAQAIDGVANQITATICRITGDQPADVCSSPGVVKAASTVPKG